MKLLHSMGLSAVLLTGLVTAADAQVNQHELARQILSEDRVEQFNALLHAKVIEPTDIGRTLREAMIRALERENEAYRGQREAMRLGVRYEEGDDFHAQIIEAVIALRDPQAIPALGGALGNGLMAIRAIVEFGDRAAPTVLKIVQSQESHSSLINGGLIALRFMVEKPIEQPLNSTTLESIGEAAEQRLTGEQEVTTLWRAIDLAVVLNEPRLRVLLASLATDRDEVIARGVRNPDLVQRTQVLARDRLAGAPPLPRPD